MRFSIELSAAPWERAGQPAATVAVTLAQARRAEAAGFDAIWVAEDPGSWDAFALLAAIAGETSRIGLATGVVNPFLRHPVSIASSVATLDRLSGGRVTLGLGRGQTEWLRRGLGIAVERPVERHRPLVRTVGRGKRVKDVADGHDLRLERNCDPVQTVRIACAVETLVVGDGDARDVSELPPPRNRREKPMSVEDMAPDFT